MLYLKSICKTKISQYITVIPLYTAPGYTAKLTNLLCMEFFSYIKPLIHPLYRHPPRIFYVQTRLLHRGKLIDTATKEASISDEADPVTTCWLADADIRPSTEQR